MNKNKFGILFIVIGIFLPLFLYPFTTLNEDASMLSLLANYNGSSYSERFSDLVIAYKDVGLDFISRRGEIKYKYILSSGVLFVFIGLVINLFTMDFRFTEKIKKSENLIFKIKNKKNYFILFLSLILILSFSYFFMSHQNNADSNFYDKKNLTYIAWIIKGLSIAFMATIFWTIRRNKS